MRKNKVKNDNKKTKGFVSLFLNLLLPGLGTIISGRTKIGMIQVILFCIGVLSWALYIGIPILFFDWIWALYTSIIQIRDKK